MVNRLIEPKSSEINEITLTNPEEIFSKNKSPFCILTDTNNDVIKVDIILRSGIYNEHVNGTAVLLSKLLRGGTKTKSNKEIETLIDYTGSSLHITPNRDYFHLSALLVKKHVKQIVSLIKDMLQNTMFQENYFNFIKNIEKNNIELEDENNSLLAFKTLKESIYGKDHPYGKRLRIEDIEKIDLPSIERFYENIFLLKPHFFMCGNISPENKNYIMDELGDISVKKDFEELKIILPITKPHFVEIQKKDSLQESIMLGKIFPKKNSKDFLNLTILNELLGGYFGSKLMTNIREKSGYTYGIYSRISSFNESSLFYISSDVTKSKSDKVCDEIYKEINNLIERDISVKELNELKGYLKGKILLSLDGLFSQMDNLISLKLCGLDLSYYQALFKAITDITPQDIRKLADKYLKPDSFYKVIVK